jgi:hypothetical protein
VVTGMACSVLNVFALFAQKPCYQLKLAQTESGSL